MCTVIYLPTKNGYLLSSNRDESPIRPKASVPTLNTDHRTPFIAPIDGKAGGTWIGLRSDAESIVLMNGGFIKHEFRPFGKSRGLMVRTQLEEGIDFSLLKQLKENDVEPFTMIAKTNKSLAQWVWDGNELHSLPHDTTLPHIFSSSTLYDERAKEQRTSWFTDWLKTSPEFTVKALHEFLLSHQENVNGYIMNRANRVRTLSISILTANTEEKSFFYHDLLDDKTTKINFSK